MKVTIIIPIHNSEKYLEECIQSALSQTFKDIEIFCIDDESTDSSFSIVDNLKKRDDRIAYVRDSNASYGHKINLGIRMAKGKYIAILESDDKMCPNMIEQLYYYAEKHNTDYTDADYFQLFCYKDKEYQNRVKKNNNLTYFKNGTERAIATHGIWTALYKKEFIEKNHIFLNESEGASYQDTSFLFLTSLLAQSVYHVGIPFYKYRIDNVNSSVKDDKKVYEIIGECEFLKNELGKRHIQDGDIWRLYYIRKYNAYYWNYHRLSDRSKQLFLSKYVEELKRDINSGKISRAMFPGDLYNRTFLLLDNKNEFIIKGIENDKKVFIKKIYELLQITENRETVIFGAGKLGIKVLDMLMQNDNCVQGICDNSEQLQNTRLKGLVISSVKKAVHQFPNALFIIISLKYSEEMKRQLLEYEIAEDNIVIYK